MSPEEIRIAQNGRSVHPEKSEARLAQPVEQLICNQQVGGSSPSTGTGKNKALLSDTCRLDIAGLLWGYLGWPFAERATE